MLRCALVAFGATTRDAPACAIISRHALACGSRNIPRLTGLLI
jgi:hypothetical protein